MPSIEFQHMLNASEVEDQYINLTGLDKTKYGPQIGPKGTILSVLDAKGRQSQMKRHGGNQLTRCARWYGANNVNQNTKVLVSFDPDRQIDGHPVLELKPLPESGGENPVVEPERKVKKVEPRVEKPDASRPAPYTKQDALKELFLEEHQFDEMLGGLREKKNVVLQGAPGVGKTFVAKRLAFALMGSKDLKRVEMVQFHQSYSYEDFIQGFRPTPNGHFEAKYGIFYRFCSRAQEEEAQEKPYVFIIDEINRGNLSKIFGELMMLIEPDKRGEEHSIPLAYSQDADKKFFIPENLHLIGTMNTADRSLAMVDYALRRRFRFITLRPEFASMAFQQSLGEAGAPPELVKKVVTRMSALNEVIAEDTKNLGPGYKVGHSYFCPRKGINPDDHWYRRVVESEIVPLIQEYWFDNEEKVKEQQSALLTEAKS